MKPLDSSDYIRQLIKYEQTMMMLYSHPDSSMRNFEAHARQVNILQLKLFRMQ